MNTFEAVKACYGWKTPLAKTKNSDFSLFLFLLALFFWIARLLWLVQPVKFVIRVIKGRGVDIHPLVVELYMVCSVAVWSLLLFCFTQFLGRYPCTILWLCGWAIFETISSNLYYLLLRPSLDSTSPHNLYRSVLLAVVSYVQVLIVFSVGWCAYTAISPDALYYNAGPHDGSGTAYSAGHLNAIQSLYFVAVTTTTLGYGDYSPDRANSCALLFAMATLGAGVTMISVIIARAVSLVPGLPKNIDRDHPRAG